MESLLIVLFGLPLFISSIIILQAAIEKYQRASFKKRRSMGIKIAGLKAGEGHNEESNREKERSKQNPWIDYLSNGGFGI